ncbi:MAG: hypothetical protein ACR2L1_00185 [Pyrinomonadaceae bacterium]
MNASVSSILTDNPKTFASTEATERENSVAETPPSAIRGLVFELGLWLSGLESFLLFRNQSFGEGNQSKAVQRDWAKEFYLTNSTLLLCSNLALHLGKILKERESSGSSETEAEFLEEISGATMINEFSFEEIFDLSVALKDSILLNEALLRAAPLKFVEWTSWSNVLADKLRQVPAAAKLINNAERQGENFLPSALQDLLENKPISLAAEADLRVVLPLFAKILKWLDMIDAMLKRDEPLKPALLLFARINEQTQALMNYINNRLRRFADEEDELFMMLDSTVYAASIEVRKVYNFELVGLSEIRQTPLVRAKIETAHGLLNDCFQQVILNFAQLVEPQIEPTSLFPNFRTKLEQSLDLRRDLWLIQKAVQKSERNLNEYPLENLYKELTEFQNGTMKALFYKDLETVERFIEEVLRTHGKNDVVPILHRLGAYLETLLGQVNMRTVLAKHPFEIPAE